MGRSPVVAFRWRPEFLARLDAARGEVPRSRYVRRAVEREMERDEVRGREGLPRRRRVIRQLDAPRAIPGQVTVEEAIGDGSS